MADFEIVAHTRVGKKNRRLGRDGKCRAVRICAHAYPPAWQLINELAQPAARPNPQTRARRPRSAKAGPKPPTERAPANNFHATAHPIPGSV
jgi:hypothetical protein